MRKKLIYVQIALWSCIILFGLGVLAYSLASEFVFDGHSETVNILGSYEYKVGEYTKKYTVAPEKIKEMRINLVSEDVILSEGDTEDIQILHHSNRKLKSKEELRLNESGQRLEISKKRDFGLFNFKIGKEVVEIQIPRNLMLELKIELVSGKITVEDGNYEDITLSTVSGDQYLGEVNARQVDMDTTSGSMSSRALSCEKFDSESISGKLDFGFTTMPDKIDGQSVSGNINLTFPKNSGFELDYETVSGRLQSDFDINWEKKEKMEGRGVYESKHSSVDVETISGNIDINK